MLPCTPRGLSQTDYFNSTDIRLIRLLIIGSIRRRVSSFAPINFGCFGDSSIKIGFWAPVFCAQLDLKSKQLASCSHHTLFVFCVINYLLGFRMSGQPVQLEINDCKRKVLRRTSSLQLPLSKNVTFSGTLSTAFSTIKASTISLYESTISAAG